MNDEFIEEIYSKINYYRSIIKDLSYDDVSRRTNADKIKFYQGKISELKWVIRELLKEEDTEGD